MIQIDDEGAKNPEGFTMLKEMAENGDFECQKNLSYMYYEADGVNRNLEQSLFWANVAISSMECTDEEKLTIDSRIGYILMNQKDYECSLKKFKSILDSHKLMRKQKI